MKDQLENELPRYRDRLRIQIMDNSMWGIFLRWLQKLNQKPPPDYDGGLEVKNELNT